MKRPFLYLAAPLVLVACLGNVGLPGRIRGSAGDLAGRIFPEDAPPAEGLPEGALRVEDFAPAGEVPWQNLEGGVWVLFNKPVVPLAKLGKPAASSPVIEIRPAMAGTFRWYGSRLLSFEPAGALAPATEYTVLLNPKQVSLDGSALAGLDAFRFRTPVLQMLSLEPSGTDIPPEECRTLRLAFNYPVDLETLHSSLRVEAGGREYPFELRWSGEGTGTELERRLVLLELKRELPWASDVHVQLKEGARPASGAYGTTEEQILSFHTLEGFQAENVELYDWLPTVEAAVLFNHPVAEEGALKHLSVDLPGYRVEEHASVEGSAVYLRSLPVAFESSFKVTVLAGLKDLYGQSLEEDQEFSLEVGPAASYVYFRASGDGILEAGFPPLAVVEFQNVLNGSYAAGPLPYPFQSLPAAALTSYETHLLPRNTRLFRAVDLAPFLNGEGKGSAFARWKFTVPSWWDEEPYVEERALRLQVTGLGMSTHLAHDRLLVWATSLATGQGEGGAEVFLRGSSGGQRRAVTDSSGLASFALAPGELAEENLEVEVRKGADRLVFRPGSSPSYTWNFHDALRAGESIPMTYLCSDRGIYRPGESLSFFGIDMDRSEGLKAHSGPYAVELRQGWSDEKAVARSAGDLSASGRFWGTLELPQSMEPDDYRLVYLRAGEKYSYDVPVKIAFFRRVAFAVDLTLPAGPWYMGDRLSGTFSGRYLAGGSLTRGKWSWWWARQEIPYRLPDPQELYEGFRFGARSGGAEYYDEYYGEEYEGYYEDLSRAEGALGGDGSVTAVQKLAEGRPGRVYRYELNATIEDVDRQAVSRRAEIPVFTSELLIGARLSAKGDEPLYFVPAGEAFRLDVCALDPLGAPYAGSAKLEGKLLRENWKMVREKGVGGRIDTRWEREEILEKSFSLSLPGRRDSQGRQLAGLQLATGQVGSYWIELRGQDRQGREALTRIDFYSTGAADVLWQRYDEKRIELVLDKSSYRPGEKAKVLIKSPLDKGRYLLTVEREGILEQRLLELSGSTDTVEINIKESHIPVVYVSLSAGTGRTAPPPDSPDLPDLGKPRGCFGLKAVLVDPEPRRIEVAIVSAQKTYRPGTEAELTVRAAWQGKPLEGAEIALVAADRGVLDLIGYHLPNPLSLFYDPGRYPDLVHHCDSRELLIDPVVWKVRDLPGGDKEGEAEEAAEDYPVRKDFRATAVFAPTLVTGRDGTVSLRFKLPDSLTTFRATAVAAKGGLFGMAEEELEVRNPINLRAALPRLLRAGDEAAAGVVVTNLTEASAAVEIRAESDLLELLEKPQKRLTLKAGESREVAFRWRAPRAGRAAVSFSLESQALKERLETALTVQSSSVREVFTVVGQTEDRVEEAVVVPADFLGEPEEGLKITLDSTIASSLIEAIRFLEVFPYDCLEQRTSKLFAFLLYDWLADGRSRIERELAALSGYQNEDGGLSFWPDPGRRVSSYYVSARTAHLLAVAGERGIPAPKGLDWESLVSYLSREYAELEPALKPYALYVQSLLGQDVRSEAARLFAARERLGIMGRCLLGLAFLELRERRQAERILGEIRSYLRVGTRSVTLTGPVDSWYYYGGELQAKAVLLMLYRRLEPESQMVQALADDLLASHKKGYWYDTATTGWVLEAFAEYLDREREADFRARVLLSSSELASATFQGPSRKPFTASVDAAALTGLARKERKRELGPSLPLVFGKEGEGRLYYAATLSYALAAERVEARDEGIGLSVLILDTRGKAVEGPLKLGELYRLKAVLYSSRDRDFLALRLPIPAGAEPIDGSLDTSLAVPPGMDEETEGYWYYEPIQRIYDDEVRFLFDSFPRGKREVSLLIRATSHGSFRTPPATAELMYEEEVFGRTSGRTYRIVP